MNGSPSIVNVEDLNLLDKKGMEQSSQFQDLKVQFPKVDLWPGDRDGKIWPDSQPGATGGKQFRPQLSSTQWLSRLRAWRGRHLYLELRRTGQIPGHDVRRHDPTSAQIALIAESTTLRLMSALLWRVIRCGLLISVRFGLRLRVRIARFRRRPWRGLLRLVRSTGIDRLDFRLVRR